MPVHENSRKHFSRPIVPSVPGTVTAAQKSKPTKAREARRSEIAAEIDAAVRKRLGAMKKIKD